MSEKPRKLLAAWTAERYEPPYPPFINVTQVGSMVELIVRGDNGVCASILVNAWTLSKIAKTFREASDSFDTSMPSWIETPTTPDEVGK